MECQNYFKKGDDARNFEHIVDAELNVCKKSKYIWMEVKSWKEDT